MDFVHTSYKYGLLICSIFGLIISLTFVQDATNSVAAFNGQNYAFSMGILAIAMMAYSMLTAIVFLTDKRMDELHYS
jgi:hypothetical protein